MSTLPLTVSDDSPIYDKVFFCSYLANVFMLMSISVLFRYADFVESLGGSEWHLGWIVGLGTVGAIIFRIFQGTAIDRFGPMLVWILSLLGLIASNLFHIGIQDVDGWPIYACRFLMNLCIAGVFGSWLSFVSLRVPAAKVAEVIGVVGSSGFAGMALGPVIGDWIFSRELAQSENVAFMFQVSAGLLCGSLIAAATGGFLDWRHARRRPCRSTDRGKAARDQAFGIWCDNIIPDFYWWLPV